MGREFKACRGRICGIQRFTGIHGASDPDGEDVEDCVAPMGREKFLNVAMVAREAAFLRFVHTVSPGSGRHHLCLHELAILSH